MQPIHQLIYRKVWLVSACAYFVSGKKLCAYYIYALITCMRVCKTRVRRIQGPAQPKHYKTAMRAFLPQQSSTDLHAVACNLGKLNAGTKIHASHLSADTHDCSYLLKCYSVPYATVQSITLLHACKTCIHVLERAGLGHISEACTYSCVYVYV